MVRAGLPPLSSMVYLRLSSPWIVSAGLAQPHGGRLAGHGGRQMKNADQASMGLLTSQRSAGASPMGHQTTWATPPGLLTDLCGKWVLTGSKQVHSLREGRHSDWLVRGGIRTCNSRGWERSHCWKREPERELNSRS